MCRHRVASALVLAAAVALAASMKTYNTKGGPVPDKLNVHLVAHT